MISISKRASPNFKVVEHQPWRRPVVMLTTIVIGVACLLIGFTLGQNKVLSSQVSAALLDRDLDGAQQRIEQLDAELIDARLNVEVQREASNALRDDITAALQKSARLQEEVTFYKGLMSPSSLSKGLQVADLELTPTANQGEFGYQLLLTQVALRRSYIAGEVRIDVLGGFAGSDENNEAVLSLTELSELKTYPVKFRFRYFQDLVGLVTFPEGFVPDRILVTAQQKGKESIQVTFPWLVEHLEAEEPELEVLEVEGAEPV